MKGRYRFFLGILWGILLAGQVVAESDWPHWRGASRNGQVAANSGWEEGVWPSPPVLWSADLGVGSSSVLVFEGRLYGIGFEEGRDVVRGLDGASGGEVWRQSYASPEYGRHARGDQSFFRGATVTPEMDVESGWLYTLSVDGELRCWNARDGGRGIWRVNLYDRFEVPCRPQVTKRGGSWRDYGYTCSPLIHGNWLLVEVGDPVRGNLMAFDKRTGELMWRSENRDPAGHAGGIAPMVVDGVPCVAVLTALNLVVTRLDAGQEGELVGQYPWVTDFINNIPTPAVEGQEVVVTSKYNRRSMARLHVTLSGIDKLWEKPVASGVCSPVIAEGQIYWANRDLYCVDLSTGETRWRGGRFGDAGSCIYTADRRLIVWANEGDLALVESASRSPRAFQQLALRRGLLRETAWPHVVLAGRRLYCKDRSGRLKCLALAPGVKASSTTAGGKTVRVGEASTVGATPFSLANWPTLKPALLLGWKEGGGKRNLTGSLPSAGRCLWEGRGEAGFGSRREMVFSRGAFLLQGGAGGLLRGLRASNEFTLEVILACGDDRQNGPARIVTFSESAYSRNFTLGQERDQFVMRLRTTRTGENGSRPEVRFGRVEPGRQTHLVVTYRDGDLVCYQNGAEVFRRRGHVRGTFGNWTPQHFVLGDEWNGGREWSGRLFGVALYGEFTGVEEVGNRYRGVVE